MATEHYIASWNLENLFDIDGSPRRTDKVKRALGKSIQGWKQEHLDGKVRQLAAMIGKMKGGAGPDLLGVCEVENAFVLELLIQALQPLGREYRYVHHDSDDERGIDVALIYDAKVFTAGDVFDHFVMRRTATRDILQVTFTTAKGRKLIVLVNHWPSRSNDTTGKSAGYRAIAGETLAYFHDRIHQELGPEVAVLAMGDFNDEPFDRSLEDYALSTRSAGKVRRGQNWYFLNLMWPLLGAGGTLYYDGCPNLFDQFLVDKTLLKEGVPLALVPGSAEILAFPEMATNKGEPIRFGGMEKEINQNGFSDHFPIAVRIAEAD